MTVPETRTLYASPPTFMEALLECSAFLEQQRVNSEASKDDVLDSMERRISLLVGKLAAQPSCAAFRIVPIEDPLLRP
jgi:hypothetical protein